MKKALLNHMIVVVVALVEVVDPIDVAAVDPIDVAVEDLIDVAVEDLTDADNCHKKRLNFSVEPFWQQSIYKTKG